MQLSSIQICVDRQKRIENYYLAKSILRNAGIVSVAFTLIFLGITLIVDFNDLKFDFALLLSILLTLVCFTYLSALNRKIRELQAVNRMNARANRKTTAS